MKVLFVFPSIATNCNNIYTKTYFKEKISKFISRNGVLNGLNKKSFHIPPITLMTLASLTPKTWNFDIVDERIRSIDTSDLKVDLVAISTTTLMAYRAYAICRFVKKYNPHIPIILGGVHPSVCPEECLKHADSVCIGEAEYIWEDILKDTVRSKLKKIYSQSTLTQPEDFPVLDKSAIDESDYLTTNVLHVVRGCPNSCNYCSGRIISGRKVRRMPLNMVAEEINSFSGKLAYLVDDNILSNVKMAFQIATLLGKKGIKWFGAAQASIIEYPSLIKHLSNSGCFLLGIGFESLNYKNLIQYNKKINSPQKYFSVVDALHKENIAVFGMFIFGGDGDSNSTFKKTLKFIEQSNIDLAQFSILTPFPGTVIREEMVKENRIISNDWNKYDSFNNAVYTPSQMTPEELVKGTKLASKKLYQLNSIAKRIIRSRTHPFMLFAANIGFRQAFFIERSDNG